MKKKKRENILAIIALLIAFIGFKMYFSDRNKETEVIYSEGCVTVGQIVKRDLPGARTISKISYYYYYYVEGVRNQRWENSYEKIPVGSFFRVIYLPDAPEKSRMDFSKPVPADSVYTYFENECPFEIGK